jgi:hypothetical protein
VAVTEKAACFVIGAATQYEGEAIPMGQLVPDPGDGTVLNDRT